MQKRKQFGHLTEHDRDRIHALYGYGHTKKQIADVLGVHNLFGSFSLQKLPSSRDVRLF